MNFGIRAKLIAAFGLLAAISIGNFGFLWMADKNAAEQQAWVLHTHTVLQDSEILLGHLKDAETGQRGFLLTGQPVYLEPFDNGVSGALSDIQHLKELTSDNPEQQTRLARIEDLTALKFSELTETIELTKRGKHADALTIVNSDAGREFMDAIRVQIREFRDEEKRLLKERVSSFESQKDEMELLMAGEAVLLLGLIIIIAMVIQRRLVAPVIQLTRNTGRLAAGEDVLDIETNSDDEMGQLVDAFHSMAHKINTTMDSLAQAWEEAEDKEHRLAEIIWSTNVGTWEWNIETDDIQFNERWAEITGHKLAELLPVNADTWRDIVHPEDMKVSNEELQKHFSGESEEYECETRRRHKNGEWVWVLDRGKVVEWSKDGKPLRMTGTNTDISARKESEKAKAEFVSTVSHELRTPLTSIKGSLGLIKSGATGELPDKLQSMLDIAYNNSDRLVLLINDILDMEKIEAGKMDFHIKPVDVQILVNEAIEANKGYGDEHNVKFVRAGLKEQVLIDGDHDRLMQVLSNLMSNAAKFSPEGEQVLVSINRNKDAIRIAVEDKGPGIPEEFRDNIFEKFSQADSSDTRKVGGTGLGRSITKVIVEKHNGTIDFETQTGKGSTFFIDLPELIERSESKPEKSKANGHNILICEDEADVAAILEGMLSEAGFTTVIARTAESAKKMLKKYKFDAMTLDLDLPDQDGISLMQDLRVRPKSLSV